MPLEQREVTPSTVVDGQPVAADGELLDVVIGKTKYSKEDKDLLRRTICKDATEDEFAMFMKYAERTGLDPFAKQICLVKRKGRCAIQVQIDGYRLIADRTKLYAGNDEAVFEGEGQFPNGRTYPLKAKATVWKLVNGKREPFTAAVRWEEFYPGDGDEGFMYRAKPFLMLGKCSESQAFRKAFPADLAGLYTPEDLAAPGETADGSTSSPATIVQGKGIEELRRSLGMEMPELAGLIKGYGFASSAEMSAAAAQELIYHLQDTLADKRR